MKVLIIGGGGREHALAWKLVRESADTEIVAAPGNPGIARVGRCVPVSATDIDGLLALAKAERPAFTLVGPEAPLALGIVDRFQAERLPIFGPTRAAAEIETSKAFAKQLMLDAGIPTARATRHTDADDAKHAARALGAPVVVKASGLAAGKGVVVAQTLEDAERAIDDMLVSNVYGDAGAEVLVEEYMEGEELSLFYLTDGDAAVALVPAQDHKRLLDGDAGPNTGGMGAYAPVLLDAYAQQFADMDAMPPGAPEAIRAISSGMTIASHVHDSIVIPTLAALGVAGRPFTGVLYAGLMLTDSGPKVVEFNCRFGDPETQAVMVLLDAMGVELMPMLLQIARGEPLSATWRGHIAGAAVTTVLAAAGYPDRPRTGDPITIPDTLPDGVELFHAGTALNADGQLVTAGGRVLAVTAVATSFDTARTRSLSVAESIRFEGRQLRTDIGWREAERRSQP